MRLLENIVRKNWFIYYTSRLFYELVLSNLFFEPECQIFKNLKKKNKLKIIDIGSSNGVFSRYIAKYIYNSKFYCFEPLFFLHNQIKINNNNNKSVLIKKGCGEKKQTVFIFTPFTKLFNLKLFFKSYSSIDLNFVKKGLLRDFKKTNFLYKKTKININKLDSFNLQPDIIKIDIENYELKIILGAIKTIKKYKPIILIENPSKRVDQIFKNLNYAKFQYLRDKKKLIGVKLNNNYSYNYFYIYKKNVNDLFY